MPIVTPRQSPLNSSLRALTDRLHGVWLAATRCQVAYSAYEKGMYWEGQWGWEVGNRTHKAQKKEVDRLRAFAHLRQWQSVLNGSGTCLGSMRGARGQSWAEKHAPQPLHASSRTHCLECRDSQYRGCQGSGNSSESPQKSSCYCHSSAGCWGRKEEWAVTSLHRDPIASLKGSCDTVVCCSTPVEKLCARWMRNMFYVICLALQMVLWFALVKKTKNICHGVMNVTALYHDVYQTTEMYCNHLFW